MSKVQKIGVANPDTFSQPAKGTSQASTYGNKVRS